MLIIIIIIIIISLVHEPQATEPRDRGGGLGPLTFLFEGPNMTVAPRGVNLVQNVGASCAGGLGDRSPPVGSRGEAPVGICGTKSPRS